jgi:hypothetical protein
METIGRLVKSCEKNEMKESQPNGPFHHGRIKNSLLEAWIG